MTASQAISLVGSGTGIIYLVAQDGTSIITAYPNNAIGYAQAKSAAVGSAPLGAASRAFATINISAVAGVGLNLNTLTINGVSQIAGAVGMTNLNPTASAASIATAINAYVAGVGTDYSAESVGGMVYILRNATGSAANGHVLAVNFDPGVTYTTTNVSGGQAGDLITDPLIGYRVFINSAATDPTSLAGATEVTDYFVMRGLQAGAMNVGVNSVAGNKITFARKASIMNVVVTSGAALASVKEIVVDGPQLGDIILLSGADAANGIEVTDYSSGTDNIHLSNGANYDSQGSDAVIVLRYLNDATSGYGWYEVSRTAPLPATPAQMRAIGIPISPNGVTTITLANPNQPAATVTLDPGTDAHTVKITAGGAVTLTGNYAIAFGGAPLDADTFYIFCDNVAITAGLNTFTINGIAVPTELLAVGQWSATVTWDGTAWNVGIFPSFYPNNFISSDKIIDLDGAKIQAGTIPTAAYAPLSVDNAALGLNSVGTANIQPGAVDVAQLSATVQASLGCVYCAKVTLTSAQILQLNTTPVSLVPAQGVGKYIVPISIQTFYQFNTTAYTLALGENGIVYVPTSSNNIGVFGDTFGIDQVVNYWGFGEIATTPNQYTASNQPLVISTSLADPTLGDGTLTIWVTYKVLTP